MSIIDAFNSLIIKINSVSCIIRNMQQYIGVNTDTSNQTLTGRIYQLEQNGGGGGNCNYDCTIIIEWSVIQVYNTQEW